MHGDENFAGIQTHYLCRKFPSPSDGFLFEIIAETEIAHHFKKGVVTGGVAHVLKIVMLAAGTHAALSRGRSLVARIRLAQQRVFELIHASIGKQQRRVVIGHQGTGWNDAMPFGLIEVQKSVA